jgi:Raf kinase inhibitor-like YbhB/YbcL family protein
MSLARPLSGWDTIRVTGITPARLVLESVGVKGEWTMGIQFPVRSDDPDARMGTWVHWVMWNTPPSVQELAESVPPKPELPDGSRRGIIDFRRPGYGGHRYYFRIYALDTTLKLPSTARKADLLKAMWGHVLAEGQLMGKYGRR